MARPNRKTREARGQKRKAEDEESSKEREEQDARDWQETEPLRRKFEEERMKNNETVREKMMVWLTPEGWDKQYPEFLEDSYWKKVLERESCAGLGRTGR